MAAASSQRQRHLPSVLMACIFALASILSPTMAEPPRRNAAFLQLGAADAVNLLPPPAIPLHADFPGLDPVYVLDPAAAILRRDGGGCSSNYHSCKSPRSRSANRPLTHLRSQASTSIPPSAVPTPSTVSSIQIVSGLLAATSAPSAVPPAAPLSMSATLLQPLPCAPARQPLSPILHTPRLPLLPAPPPPSIPPVAPAAAPRPACSPVLAAWATAAAATARPVPPAASASGPPPPPARVGAARPRPA